MDETEIGPESDVDEPIENHVEELLFRVFIISSFGISTALVILPLSDQIVTYLWDSHIPSASINQPRLYSPISLLLTRIKIILLAALAVSLPVAIYQSYVFMKPALYDLEEYYFKLSSITSILLSLFGLLVSQFVLIPLLFSYFTSYNQGAADLAYGLQETVGIMILLMIYMVIVFQIPVLIILAVKTGVVSIRWIMNRRIVFWVFFGGLSFIASPDPTGATPIIISIITVLLFELSLIVAKKLPETKKQE